MFTPLVVAVTVYEPGVLFAVNVGAFATPWALVITTHVIPLQGRSLMPAGDLSWGSVKVTFTLGHTHRIGIFYRGLQID